jgi:hypothetical protein
MLGVRFEGEALVLKPTLFPSSPPVRADLRLRQSRLRLILPGAGPPASAQVNGKALKADTDGAFRLPADLVGGTVVFELNKPSG